MTQRFRMFMSTEKGFAFGIAVVATVVASLILFFVFGGYNGGRYGELIGINEPREGVSSTSISAMPTPIEEDELAAFLLHTAEKKKNIPSGCVAGTEVKSQTTRYATIELTYPRLCDATFDGTVEYIVQSEADRLTRRAEAEVPEYREVSERADARYALIIEPHGLYANASLASVLLTVYMDTGGAHGNTTLYSVSVDRAKAKRLLLDDIFESGSGHLQALSRISEDVLVRELGDGVFTEGLAPRESNFIVFTLTGNAITFHFAPYQVAAYAAGVQSVEIPYSALSQYWKQ